LAPTGALGRPAWHVSCGRHPTHPVRRTGTAHPAEPRLAALRAARVFDLGPGRAGRIVRPDRAAVSAPHRFGRVWRPIQWRGW